MRLWRTRVSFQLVPKLSHVVDKVELKPQRSQNGPGKGQLHLIRLRVETPVRGRWPPHTEFSQRHGDATGRSLRLGKEVGLQAR